MFSSDFYVLLGVDKTATKEKIQSAFKKLSLSKHPDKVRQSGGSEEEVLQASENYKLLSLARDTLIDRDKREAYDITSGNTSRLSLLAPAGMKRPSAEVFDDIKADLTRSSSFFC